jgi:hypothetical protein
LTRRAHSSAVRSRRHLATVALAPAQAVELSGPRHDDEVVEAGPPSVRVQITRRLTG